MKTIYLFRHSKTDKNSDLGNELLPLSQDGKRLMQKLAEKLPDIENAKVISSSFVRAKQSAEMICQNVLIDGRLQERKIGNIETFTKEIWESQYHDLDVKNINGESFRMVQKRMDECMIDILQSMSSGQCAAAVSHAAAICAYLFKFCTIEIVDAETKHRRIMFQNHTVLDGQIEAPSCFVLVFDKELVSISYIK